MKNGIKKVPEKYQLMKAVSIKYKGGICGIEPLGGKRVRVFTTTTESWTTTKHDELITWFTDLNRLSKKKAEKLVREALGFDPGPYRMWK